MPVTDTPTMDGQVLLAHIFDRPRTWVMAHPEAKLSSEQYQDLQAALDRLETNEPLPYVLGHWEFFGLEFIVTPSTLIPRPETELLVEHGLEWLRENPTRQFAADVGTGAGAIAIAMATHISYLRVLASDILLAALQVTTKNIYRHGLYTRVFAVQADLIPVTSRPFDLICANLPYIPTETLQNLDVYLREPETALDGGPDGLDLISRLLDELVKDPSKISSNGLLLIEIDATQGVSVQKLVSQILPKAKSQVFRDLTGRDRLVAIQIIND